MESRSAGRAVMALRAVFATLVAVLLLSPTLTAAAQAPTSTGWTPATSTSTVRVLGISDFSGAMSRPAGFQGQLLDAANNRNPAGGGAYLAATVDKLRDQSPDSLLVSAGDNVGSTAPENEMLDDRPTVQFLNRMGVAASSIGEKDLENGLNAFGSLVRPDCVGDSCPVDAPLPAFSGADFPHLAANVPDAPGAPAAFPFSIHRVGENRVGVIGVTDPDGVFDFEFSDPVAAVRESVDTLRFLGVNTIVTVLHTQPMHTNVSPGECPSALEGDQLIRDLPDDVDAVVVGHSGGPATCRVQTPSSGERIVIAPASHGRSIGVVDLVIDDETGSVVQRQTSGFNQPVNHDIAPADWALELTADAERAAQEPASEPLGEITTEISHQTDENGESPLANFFADALLAAGDGDAADADGEVAADAGEATADTRGGGPSADLAVANPDSFTMPLPAGPADYSTLHSVLPYSDRLFRVELSGADLSRALSCLIDEVGDPGPSVSHNVSYGVDPSAGECEKLTHFRIDGDDIDPDRVYSVVLSEFLASAEWVDSPVAVDPEPLHMTDMNALRSHVDRNTPVPAPSIGRVDVDTEG